MKKISKVAALLAASALLFGGMFLSCSDSDDDGNTSQVSGPSSNSGSGNSGSGNSGSGNSGNSGSGDNGGSGNQETATTDSWDFTTYANAVFVNPDAAGSVVVKSTTEKTVNGVNMTEYEKDGTYYLSADATQLGAEGNLSLTLSKAGTGKTNTTNKNGASYSYQEGSTSGLRIKYDAFKIASVKGKVALTIEWYCIQDKAAGERNLELRIGDSGTVESIGIDATTGAEASVKMTNVFKEFDAGTGTNIYIGASNNIFIKSITIAKQAGAFTASTNNTTANDVATLGLVGTSVSSSAETVATAVLSDGKVAITSVGAGEAVITVKDANDKTATIAVTVASSGDITLGAITKYARPAPSAEVTKKASSATAADGEGTVTWDGLTDLEWSIDGTNWSTVAEVKTQITTFDVAIAGTTATVTGLPAGTYYVRGAASDAYEATESKKVVVTFDGSALAWTVIGGSDAAKFTSKAVTINKSTGIYLPVTYATGKKVVLTFTVDKASVNADTGSKICGGFAQNDTFADTTYAVFASNKGISNGSKAWSNGGSSNGYGSSVAIYTGKTEAVEDVTFTVTYTVGKESTDGTTVVLNGTITDGTTTGTKAVKQKEMKWTNVAGTVQSSVVPYIYFGAGATESITVSNIKLTVDDAAVATNAD